MSYDPIIYDYSWVYVTRLGWRKYTIGIAFREDYPLQEAIEGREVILWRRFDDLMAAVGYRMILLGLSTKELLVVVKRYNERQKLKKRFMSIQQENNIP